MRSPLFETDLDTRAEVVGAGVDGAGWVPRGNAIYVMLKPSADLARNVRALDETIPGRPPDLLHTIIQPIGDRSWITDADIEATRRALARVRHAPFLMLFDRIEGGDSLSLRGGIRNCAAQEFRLVILDALFGHFERLPAYRLHPHMTVNDRGGGRPGRLLAQPIAWLVDEFVLVESVHGETRHVELGRWRLRED